jgi:hypothetical protein
LLRNLRTPLLLHGGARGHLWRTVLNDVWRRAARNSRVDSPTNASPRTTATPVAEEAQWIGNRSIYWGLPEDQLSEPAKSWWYLICITQYVNARYLG